MTDLLKLSADFKARFGAEPRLFRAPGRVNLIGEHTDYNAGFVMPAAIRFYTSVAIAPRADRQLRIHSANFAETRMVPLPGPLAPPSGAGHGSHWIDYVCGVAWALQEQGIPVCGADMLIHGEVPLGAGLSSSAALEVAAGLALSSIAGHPLEGMRLAKACQRAENQYVGMRCGIMDQFAAVHGRAGHAMMLDCRSLEYRLLALHGPAEDPGQAAQLVICNTMVRHQLAGSEYNRRREQCEQGVQGLARAVPGIETLRDVTEEQLRTHKPVLDGLIYRRCRHVVTENARVVAAARALEAADLAGFGRLMGESHRSLRDDYEVSCDELDLMVRLAESIDGVYGARMTGGGFGGCTVNLVRTGHVEQFGSRIAAGYARATGHRAEIYVCEAADGAAPVALA
ncbi:MAG: galactokinase [Steroidobacterales bacterium]